MSDRYSYYVSYSFTKDNNGFGFGGNVISSFSKLIEELILSLNKDIREQLNL